MAIDDNTSYELTGAQVKDLASKIKAKADSSSLATVATSGSYADLSNKPTIPTVSDGTLTIQQNGTTVGTFTANQSSATTVSLTDTTYSAFTGTDGTVAGAAGLVPAPATTDAGKFLKADGTWGTAGGGSSTTVFYMSQIIGSYRFEFWHDSAKTSRVTQAEFISALRNGVVVLEIDWTVSTQTGEDKWVVVQSNVTDAGSTIGLNFTAYGTQTMLYYFTWEYGNTYAIRRENRLEFELTAGPNIAISRTTNGTTISATDTTYSAFTGASSGTAGTSGLVPAPAAGDEAKVLSGAGTWVNQSGGSTYTAGNGISISANDEISIDTSVVAELSDLPTVNDGTLTIQHNGTTKGTFTANQSTASTVNIETIYADTPGTATTPAASVQASDIVWSTMPFNYSTTEVDTGCTWIDGSHIYKKTIDFGALPNATSKTVAHGISNLDRIVKFEGVAKETPSNVQIMLPFVNTDAVGNQIYIRADQTNITIGSGVNRSSFTNTYVTLWYTKTS